MYTNYIKICHDPEPVPWRLSGETATISLGKRARHIAEKLGYSLDENGLIISQKGRGYVRSGYRFTRGEADRLKRLIAGRMNGNGSNGRD